MQQRGRQIDRAVNVRVAAQHRGHVVVVLGGVGPHPGAGELIGRGIDIERLMLVPDDVQIQGLLPGPGRIDIAAVPLRAGCLRHKDDIAFLRDEERRVASSAVVIVDSHRVSRVEHIPCIIDEEFVALHPRPQTNDRNPEIAFPLHLVLVLAPAVEISNNRNRPLIGSGVTEPHAVGDGLGLRLSLLHCAADDQRDPTTQPA